MKNKIIIIIFCLILSFLVGCSEQNKCPYPYKHIDTSLSFQSSKGVYDEQETIRFYVVADFIKKDNCFSIPYCRFSITNETGYEIINSEYCKNYEDKFSQLYYKNISNFSIEWNQKDCLDKDDIVIIKGNYSAKLTCFYENAHGSSWEGIYHGSASNSTYFVIK